MYINRNVSRVLAAAVASTGFAVLPFPAFGDTLKCTSDTFNAATDGAGNIMVSCTPPGSTPSTPPPSPPPPPPPAGGTIACSGYAKTLVYDLPWAAQSIAHTSGFGNEAIVVARFTTPATSLVSGTANVAAAQYTEPTVTRTASLSTVPCDLTGQGTGAVSGGVAPGASWTYKINGSSTSRLGIVTTVALQPNTTYYVNITNRDKNGSPTCTSTSCEMIVQLTKPTGL